MIRVALTLIVITAISVRAASIEGKILDVSGRPLPFVEVRGPAGTFDSSTVNGRFSLDLDDKFVGKRVNLSFARMGWELVAPSVSSVIVASDSSDSRMLVRMKALNTIPRAQGQCLSFSYMRLFGAALVPAILKTFVGIEEDFSSLGMIDPTGKARSFLRIWPYKDARLIKTPPMDEVLQHSEGWTSDYYNDLAFGDPPKDPRVRAFMEHYPDERGKDWRPNHDYKGVEGTEYDHFTSLGDAPYSALEMVRAVEKAQQKVGFLFIVVRNELSTALTDVALQWKRVAVQRSMSAEVAEQKLSVAEIQRKVISRLGPGETVLMLLAVYLKDKSGFPDTYVSDVIRPVNTIYTTAHTVNRQAIRLPLLEKATPILLPIGWYHQ